MTRQFSGIGVQPGVVLGPVRRVVEAHRDERIIANQTALLAALDAVADDLEAASAAADVDVVRDVLEAQSMIARDPGLVDVIETEFGAQGETDIVPIVAKAFGGFRESLVGLGGYFAERAADLDEIADRLLNKVAGVETQKLLLTEPSIVVARDLTPADTATLQRDLVLAIVVEKGGPTSHTAIVARSLAIPALVGCAGATALTDGMVVLVDGREGLAILDASAAEFEQRRSAEERRQERAAAVTGPGRTQDGRAIQLLGNAGSVADCASAVKVDAEGIGLFRTELIFLDRVEEPSVDEQIEIYSNAIRELDGRKLIFRTLDIGSDKPAPFINVGIEQNPSLGVRGWRLTRIPGQTESVINNQLVALAEAAKQTAGEVWVMAPMVATAKEASDFVRRARTVGIQKAGVMIETPAAALLARQIFEVVDFASIGTNDLSQYVMAADRLDERLADLLTPWQPALLAAIALTGAAAIAANKPLGVCGEAAADPLLAPVLIGLGVSSLSMSPGSIAEVRASIAEVTMSQATEAAQLALNAEDAVVARALVNDFLGL